jgi:predicted acyltransferase
MARDPTRDVVRGLTSLEMTFVNISGLSWAAHSDYIGQFTYADTIFPCFAFLSGMTPAPARRSVGIIGIGLALHGFIKVTYGKPAIRIPGVLQRLGVASLIASEPALEVLTRGYGAPLVALWYAVTLLGASRAGPGGNPLAHPDYPGADASQTAQTRLDTLLFGDRLYTPSYDPEGLLGCLTTAVSMVIGRAFEQCTMVPSEKIAAAIGMITAGESLHYLVPKYAPISKSLWTPSFVLATSGYSILKYLAVQAATPYLPAVVQDVLQAVGRRSLEVYVVSTLLSMLIRAGGDRSILSRAMRLIGSVTGQAWADFTTSMGLVGAVAACAKVMVSQNLRIRW